MRERVYREGEGGVRERRERREKSESILHLSLPAPAYCDTLGGPLVSLTYSTKWDPV